MHNYKIFYLTAFQNTTQSKTADFLLSAATWRTERNVSIMFDSGPFAPLCETMTSST